MVHFKRALCCSVEWYNRSSSSSHMKEGAVLLAPDDETPFNCRLEDLPKEIKSKIGDTFSLLPREAQVVEFSALYIEYNNDSEDSSFEMLQWAGYLSGPKADLFCNDCRIEACLALSQQKQPSREELKEVVTHIEELLKKQEEEEQ